MNIVKGLSQFRDAFGMLYTHCDKMLSRSEWNLAGKTAYDAMEKVAIAVEELAGIHPPKRAQHEAKLHSDVLVRVPLVAWHVYADPTSSPAIFVSKHSSPDLHIKVGKTVMGTATVLATVRVSGLNEILLTKDGSTIYVCIGGAPATALTDTTLGFALEGKWGQLRLDAARIAVLNKYLEPVRIERNTAAYYQRQYNSSEARQICSDGKSLFVPVKRGVGYRIGAGPP